MGKWSGVLCGLAMIGLAAAPALGQANLLINGDFEADGLQEGDARPLSCEENYPTLITGWTAKDLGYYQTDPGEVWCWVGEIAHMPKYNGSRHITAPISGDNYGSIDGGSMSGESGFAFQTREILPDRAVKLTGWIMGRRATGDSTTYSYAIRIRDGDENGEIIAEFKEVAAPGNPWVQIAAGGDVPPLTGQPDQDSVTIEWGFEGTDWDNAVAVHVDALELVHMAAVCNNPFADADGDGDVDQDDFGVLQVCLTGTGGGVPAEPAYCECFDRPEGEPPEKDGDIDQADVMAFEVCASGPGVAADTTCDGPP